MDVLHVGLRAQDVYESLKELRSFGPKDVKYKQTLLIGKAASLAIHLRGLLYVDDLTRLEYAASSLGISSLELPAVLAELEELDFLSVVRAHSKIKRVELRVPEFRSAYEELGVRWRDLGPSEVEEASLIALDKLYRGPLSESELTDSLGLSSSETSILRDVMSAGQLIRVQSVDGEPVAYEVLSKVVYKGRESGGLLLLPILERDSCDDVGEERGAVERAPVLLCRHRQLVDHRQAGRAAAAALGLGRA